MGYELKTFEGAGEQFRLPKTRGCMKKELEVGMWGSAVNTAEDYKAVRACGITHAFIDQSYCKRGTEEYLRLLSYCKEAGLKAYLFNYNNTKEFLADRTPYDKSEAFAGFVYWDEPTAEQFDEIASVIPEFEKRYPKAVFYVNLLPIYGLLFDPNENRTGTDSYEEYIHQFCEKILKKLHGKRILSVDYYPLAADEAKGITFLEDSWLRNLELVAEYAKRYDALPYFYIQSTSFGLWRRTPQMNDFYLQYLICLAYGVKGINHFMYPTPTGGEFAAKNIAMVDRENHPTERYYIAKIVNAQMQKMCGRLFTYDYCGTYVAVGTNAATIHERTAIEKLKNNLPKLKNVSVESEECVVIGQFEKGKKTGYLVVNFTDPSHGKENKVKIRFSGKTEISVMQKGSSIKTVSDTILFELEPGLGVFLETEAVETV